MPTIEKGAQRRSTSDRTAGLIHRRRGLTTKPTELGPMADPAFIMLTVPEARLLGERLYARGISKMSAT